MMQGRSNKLICRAPNLAEPSTCGGLVAWRSGASRVRHVKHDCLGRLSPRRTAQNGPSATGASIISARAVVCAWGQRSTPRTSTEVSAAGICGREDVLHFVGASGTSG